MVLTFYPLAPAARHWYLHKTENRLSQNRQDAKKSEKSFSHREQRAKQLGFFASWGMDCTSVISVCSVRNDLVCLANLCALARDVFRDVCFYFANASESQDEGMLVMVKVQTDSGYVGTFDNDPYCTDQIRAGTVVEFEPRHVISIWTDEPAEHAQP